MDARSWPALSIRGIITANNISLQLTHKTTISQRKKFSVKGTWLIKVWVVVDSSSSSLAWPQSSVGRRQARSGENDAQWACFIPGRAKYISVLSNSCKSDNGVARLKGSVHNTRGWSRQQPIRDEQRNLWTNGSEDTRRGPSKVRHRCLELCRNPNADVTTSLYHKMNSNFNNFRWDQRYCRN